MTNEREREILKDLIAKLDSMTEKIEAVEGRIKQDNKEKHVSRADAIYARIQESKKYTITKL
jgi:hypothetical protein